MSASTVNNKIQPLSTSSTRAGYDSAYVDERPIFLKELGDFFASLREGRGWTQSDAARYAKQKQLGGLSRNVILRLEAGKIKNPEPGTLRAVALLYDLSYDATVKEYTRVRFGIDGPRLSKAGSTVAPLGKGGPINAPSTVESAHLREIAVLKSRITGYEVALAKVRNATREISKAISVRVKGGTAARRRA